MRADLEDRVLRGGITERLVGGSANFLDVGLVFDLCRRFDWLIDVRFGVQPAVIGTVSPWPQRRGISGGRLIPQRQYAGVALAVAEIAMHKIHSEIHDPHDDAFPILPSRI